MLRIVLACGALGAVAVSAGLALSVTHARLAPQPSALHIALPAPDIPAPSTDTTPAVPPLSPLAVPGLDTPLSATAPQETASLPSRHDLPPAAAAAPIEAAPTAAHARPPALSAAPRDVALSARGGLSADTAIAQPWAVGVYR